MEFESIPHAFCSAPHSVAAVLAQSVHSPYSRKQGCMLTAGIGLLSAQKCKYTLKNNAMR